MSELKDLEQKVLKSPATRRYVTPHNITMYEDGARLKQMLNNDGDDLLSPVAGINSLKQTLVLERIQYPIFNKELSSKLAWRTITTVEGSRIHADELTIKISGEIRFESLENVLDTYRQFFTEPDSGPRN